MKAASWRHHYLPQFYLKGFVNTNGKFKIYNVLEQRFIKNGKDFSPESHFFEIDGNTILLNNEKDDFLETFYSNSDNFASIFFNKIQRSRDVPGFGLTDADMPALQYFIAVLFWRNPKNFNKVEILSTNSDLKNLGIKIINKKGEPIEDLELEEKLKQDPNFIKSMKYWIPNATYLTILNCDTPLTIQSFPKGLPSLCSDYPIIFRNSQNPNVYLDDFIFPLTNDLLLIRAKKINNISTDIKVAIDLIILKQAINYASCTDKAYIYLLNKYFSDNYNTTEELIESVFQQLID